MAPKRRPHGPAWRKSPRLKGAPRSNRALAMPMLHCTQAVVTQTRARFPTDIQNQCCRQLLPMDGRKPLAASDMLYQPRQLGSSACFRRPARCTMTSASPSRMTHWRHHCWRLSTTGSMLDFILLVGGGGGAQAVSGGARCLC